MMVVVEDFDMSRWSVVAVVVVDDSVVSMDQYSLFDLVALA
jgi:hypothetical protein